MEFQQVMPGFIALAGDLGTHGRKADAVAALAAMGVHHRAVHGFQRISLESRDWWWAASDRGGAAKLSTNAKTIERQDGSTVDLTLALDRKRRIDTAFEVYLGLYQAITGPEDRQKLYKEFSPGFFDLIVIDECHRGSAAYVLAWREILTHFSSATQIGLTATPKETEYVSNTDYFGEPVFTYSLKQGISDGFLRPTRSSRFTSTATWKAIARNSANSTVTAPRSRTASTTSRISTARWCSTTARVLTARKITEFLKESGDRFQKTIVFCVDRGARGADAASARQRERRSGRRELALRHAHHRQRQGGPGAARQLHRPGIEIPVLVTTSRLLSTGVDAQTCRLIVLDREVGSMTEFKQIVGRGTRVHEDTKKFFFTLIDFRGATSHFADPDFDGDPVQIYEPGEGEPIMPPDDAPPRR